MLFKNVKRKKSNCIKYDSIAEDKLPFWIADSDYASPKAITKTLVKRSKHKVYGYSCPGKDYYGIVINYIKRRHKYQIKEENIITANSVLGALFYAIKLLEDKSKSIVVQTPVYHWFYDVIKKSGKTVVENKLINDNGYFKMDLKELEEIFKETKIMILCSPHNPVGRMYSYEELEKLVKLAKKYNVYLLADEVHCDIPLYNNKFISLNHFYNLYENIMVFTSPSKAFNVAGLKISNVITLNLNLAEGLKDLLINSYYPEPNLFALRAIKAAYTTTDKWLLKQSKFLTSNYEDIVKYFNENHKGVVVTKMEATYLAWIDLSYLSKSCQEIYQGLQDAGILILPGKKFQERCEGFIRFNFACDKKMLKKGLNAISKYLYIVEKELKTINKQ